MYACNVFITDDNGGRAKLNRNPVSIEYALNRLKGQMYIPQSELNRAQKFLNDGQQQYTFVDGFMAGDIFLVQSA